MLADLASRRRALGIQIEQLRAARDEMAASVHGVRDKVDGILAHLERTDDEARAAALAVGDQFRLRGAERALTTRTLGGRTATGRRPAGAAAGRRGDADGRTAGRTTPVGQRPRPRSTSCSPGSVPGPARHGGPDRACGARRRPRAEADGGAPAGAAPPCARPSAAEAEAEAVVRVPTTQLIARRDEPLAPVTARLGRDTSSGPWATTRTDCSTDCARAVARRPRSCWAPRTSTGRLRRRGAAVTWPRRSPPGHPSAGPGRRPSPMAARSEQSADGLARIVVTMLRRQIADGGEELGDRVGAAFREWRGERVERLAGDYATEAFSAGVTAAAARRQGALGGHVRERLLGLRGQRARRCDERGRDVPDRPRPSTGPFGLPVPGRARGSTDLGTPAGSTRRARPLGPGWRTLGSLRAHPQRPDR